MTTLACFCIVVAALRNLIEEQFGDLSAPE
jgi:hypothetical protein